MDEHIVIQDGHKAILARYQHVLEWLVAEKERLEDELAHVAEQGQRMSTELRAALLHAYGIAPGQPFTLDTEAGRIHTVHQEPEAAPATAATEPSS